MSEATALKNQYAEDLALTIRNRARLSENQNLLYWYEQLYKNQFQDFPDPHRLKILEIGSGVSPLQRFYKNVLTSDVLELDYLDYVFDCHSIDRFDPIRNASLDVIALTNVLHHLRDPIDFLNKAAIKLKPGGKIIAVEPYFSSLSTFIFKYLHHEPVDLNVLSQFFPKFEDHWLPQTSRSRGLSSSSTPVGAIGCAPDFNSTL